MPLRTWTQADASRIASEYPVWYSSRPMDITCSATSTPAIGGARTTPDRCTTVKRPIGIVEYFWNTAKVRTTLRLSLLDEGVTGIPIGISSPETGSGDTGRSEDMSNLQISNNSRLSLLLTMYKIYWIIFLPGLENQVKVDI
ncbi:hypothetical protein OGATHE_004713 [Ogataea polymorpha]|uniref:Uncharacterized protein n=1 Tax=Ogataea polymorpha TaxID=460523 RepID=A0A9P8P0U1_9ASCO|nr:hypothetical protein OGATHE_004713 [Ogataea polymorpha]